jgi:hypothetical protein
MFAQDTLIKPFVIIKSTNHNNLPLFDDDKFFNQVGPSLPFEQHTFPNIGVFKSFRFSTQTTFTQKS